MEETVRLRRALKRLPQIATRCLAIVLKIRVLRDQMARIDGHSSALRQTAHYFIPIHFAKREDMIDDRKGT